MEVGENKIKGVYVIQKVRMTSNFFEGNLTSKFKNRKANDRKNALAITIE
jgi:hypothetical protein